MGEEEEQRWRMISIDEPVPFETQTVPSPLELPDYLFQTSRDNMVGAAGLQIKLVESRENLFHLLTQICSSDQDYGEDSDILEPFQLQPYSMNNCLVTERVLTVNSLEVFLKLLQDSVYRTLVANHWNNDLSIPNLILAHRLSTAKHRFSTARGVMARGEE